MIPVRTLNLSSLLHAADRAVWGWTLIILLLVTGVYFTISTGFIQIRRIGKALKLALSKDNTQGEGEVSSFAALCTALSAALGTGNIVGVATAISLGGPGALLWMLVAAVVGMATNYAEGVLAILYRRKTATGRYLGGPFMYIEYGLGHRWRWLARWFAVCGVLAGVLGIGTLVQSNSITEALENFFDPEKQSVAISLAGQDYTWTMVVGSVLVTALAAMVLLGGIQRIAGVSQVVVPVMAVLYTGIALTVIVVNSHRLPQVLSLVVRGAFSPEAVYGAAGGITLKTVMQVGIGRGVFSNEAGLGSTPIACAAAKSNDPVRQGLVSMTGTLIDTVFMCTVTGLSILVTDAWCQPGLEGVEVTDYAWRSGLPWLSPRLVSLLLTVCLVFFAFTTILGWNYYCERCLEYLVGGQRTAMTFMRWCYIGAVFLGPYFTVADAWSAANIFNGLMAFPNLFALLALSGQVLSITKSRIMKE